MGCEVSAWRELAKRLHRCLATSLSDPRCILAQNLQALAMRVRGCLPELDRKSGVSKVPAVSESACPSHAD